MFEALNPRVDSVAKGHAEDRRRQIAAQVEQQAPGVMAEVVGDTVVLNGHDLLRRWLNDDAALREAGAGR